MFFFVVSQPINAYTKSLHMLGSTDKILSSQIIRGKDNLSDIHTTIKALLYLFFVSYPQNCFFAECNPNYSAMQSKRGKNFRGVGRNISFPRGLQVRCRRRRVHCDSAPMLSIAPFFLLLKNIFDKLKEDFLNLKQELVILTLN